MSKSLAEKRIKLIQRQRYLIKCKCKICNSVFPDIIEGQIHITDKHPDRTVRDVIKNLSWNIEDDARKYAKLQELEDKRKFLFKQLFDNKKILEASVPFKTTKGRSKRLDEVEIKPIIDNITQGEYSKLQKKDLEKLKEDIEKRIYSRLKKEHDDFINEFQNLNMADEVQKALKGKPTILDNYLKELDYHLGIKKAYDIVHSFLGKDKKEKRRKSK
ncbi:MAG: hypothetical protein ACTSRW_14315 [Candidatus Helarchaeota archaeon]